jgi:hypothetical protein
MNLQHDQSREGRAGHERGREGHSPDHIRRQIREFDSFYIKHCHETSAQRIIHRINTVRLRAGQRAHIAITEVAPAPLEDELIAQHEVAEEVLRRDS